MSFEEFQDGLRGSHLGYRNGTILEILNLCVTVMPPIKFQLNLTGLKRRCHLKNFKIASVAAILDIGTGRILAILNLCVTVMPPIKDLGLRRRCPLKNFKMATLAAILDIRTELF